MVPYCEPVMNGQMEGVAHCTSFGIHCGASRQFIHAVESDSAYRQLITA